MYLGMAPGKGRSHLEGGTKNDLLFIPELSEPGCGSICNTAVEKTVIFAVQHPSLPAVAP